MTSPDSGIFGPDDDGFHPDPTGAEWWFTETAWFSFHHAERRLGGWFYSMFRHNIGTVAGGAWVWDDSAHLPWEVPYSTNYTALQLDPESDLRNVELPTGVQIEVIEPTMAYRLRYDDPDRFTADLTYRAVDPPRSLATGTSTFGKSAHFDQIGRVSGAIELHGESIEIDCWSMRDRTWGRRPENRPRQAAYVTGAGEDGRGFLAVTNTRDGTDRVAYGFVNHDGEQVTLVDGERTVIRDPEQGWIDKIRIEARDANGDDFLAEGTSVSRITINRHTFIDINSIVEWQVSGSGPTVQWWGEDQDMWPVHRWSVAKRDRDWGI